MSRQTLAIIALALLLGVAGYPLGKYGAEWLSERSFEEQTALLKTTLRVGQETPDIILADYAESETNLRELAQSAEALVILASTYCGICQEDLIRWDSLVGSSESPTPLYVVFDSEPEEVSAYVEDLGIVIPSYTDVHHVFSDSFAVHIYPTVIGLSQGGVVSLIHQGTLQGFTPSQMVDVMRGSLKDDA